MTQNKFTFKKKLRAQLSKAKSEIESAKNVPAKEVASIVKNEERVLKEKSQMNIFTQLLMTRSGRKSHTKLSKNLPI